MVKVTIVSNNPRQSYIVSEMKTVKQILDEKDIDYSTANVMVDGASLAAGEINKTLSDLGVVEKTVISVQVHKDNAAKATIAGSACIVTTTLKPEEIQTLKDLAPEALTLVDEDTGEEVFGLDYTPGAPGSLTAYGANLGSQTDSEGFCTITILLNPEEEDPKDLVYRSLGRPLMLLEELENSIHEFLPQLKEQEEKIKAKIVQL